MTAGAATSAQTATPRARLAWRLLEPLHAVTYFTDECHDEFRSAGLKGGLMSYIAGRTAALGAVDADAAAAALFSFHPSLIARVVPRAWTFASPTDVLAARQRGVDRALRRLLGDATCESVELAQLAAIVEGVMAAAGGESGSMFAAHRDQPIPELPHLRLWRAATVVREHRGDGHASALGDAEVSACEAHMMVVAVTDVGRDWLRFRGFSDSDCSAAEEALRDRGWLEGGALTPSGQQAWRQVEDRTDAKAEVGWSQLTDDHTTALLAGLTDLIAPIRHASVLPNPYPPVG